MDRTEVPMIAQCAQPTLTEGVRRKPRRFKGSGEADLRGFSPKSATVPTFRSLMRHIGGISKSCSMSAVSGFLATEGIYGVITDPLVSEVRRQRF